MKLAPAPGSATLPARSHRPWYHEPMVLLVVAIPAIAILASMLLIFFAVKDGNPAIDSACTPGSAWQAMRNQGDTHAKARLDARTLAVVSDSHCR